MTVQRQRGATGASRLGVGDTDASEARGRRGIRCRWRAVRTWRTTIGPYGEKRYRTALRLHDLRRSCASTSLTLGNSPRVAMEVLDHSGIAITMNTYAHVLPTLLGGAIDGMDDLLGGAADR